MAYDPMQHAMLMYCSYKGDMYLWNKWREAHPQVQIKLEEATIMFGELQEAELEGADLRRAMLVGSNLKRAILKKANLKNSYLNAARLGSANLCGANLQGAKLGFDKVPGQEGIAFGADLRLTEIVEVNLQDSQLRFVGFQHATIEKSNLQRANLCNADLQKAAIRYSNLKNAKLSGANLQNTAFIFSNLEGADLNCAELQGTYFSETNFKSAKFNLCKVDGSTQITDCTFSEDTDFSGVGLDATVIDPALKVALKNNIRRIMWLNWIKEERRQGKRIFSYLVEWFWRISDYGSSTIAIIKSFFSLAFGFGFFYWLIALIPGWNGIINDLWKGSGIVGAVQTFIRSLYFSIVTMTTLGFGDMHAASDGFWQSVLGNIILSLQVILGYLLLGALVTRLGILFAGEAPAAKPTPSTEEKITKG